MRKSFEDNLNNAITKMFNTNRNYINQEINRLASVSQRSTNYRRNGFSNFGARQMINFVNDSEFAKIGTTLRSTIVS